MCCLTLLISELFSYVELASAPSNNIEAFEALIRAMAEADMGYAAVNFPVDFCRDCGFNGVIEGDGNLVSVDEVRKLAGGDASGRVQR